MFIEEIEDLHRFLSANGNWKDSCRIQNLRNKKLGGERL